MIKEVWINKETFLPEKMTFKANWQDMYQYNELTVSGIKINQKDVLKQFSEINIPSDYKINHYEPSPKKDYKTLENGTTPFDFELKDLNDQTYKLSKLRGKVVLLDFWYTSCYPCVKALPHLEELHKTYKEQGLVILGINSYNNNDIDKKKLPDFLLKRNITYPTLLASKSIDSIFKVRVYPTLYLIGKNGDVIYSQKGYGEAGKKVLEKIIKSNL